MKASLQKPIIYKYHDHGEYIKSMMDHLNKCGNEINFSKIGDELGVSKSYISMMISGKREINSKFISKLSSLFQLSKRESSFFELMVTFSTTTIEQLKSDCLKRMKEFKKYKDLNPEELIIHDYMSNWLNVTIREMTSMNEFKDSVDWIQDNLRFYASASDIKKSLGFLRESGFITKNENGKYDRPDKDIKCVDEIYTSALTQFHRQFLNLASESITSTSSDERLLLGHCFSLNEDDYSEAKEILEEAFTKITNLKKEKGHGEKVCFIELAMFPLTNK